MFELLMSKNLNKIQSLPIENENQVLEDLKSIYRSAPELCEISISEGLISGIHLRLGGLRGPEIEIHKLPESFTKLESLEELYLRDNKLNCIPDSFGNLTKLRILDLSFNELLGLPESVGALVSLEELNLERNALISLPSSMERLVNLKELQVDQNKLNPFSQEKQTEPFFTGANQTIKD
jgi:Leucine-rich repeat (LRR) protein